MKDPQRALELLCHPATTLVCRTSNEMLLWASTTSALLQVCMFVCATIRFAHDDFLITRPSVVFELLPVALIGHGTLQRWQCTSPVQRVRSGSTSCARKEPATESFTASRKLATLPGLSPLETSTMWPTLQTEKLHSSLLGGNTRHASNSELRVATKNHHSI